jgi:cell wall assembly regulator SMI1
VEDAWRRIVAWYEANTPPGTLLLPPGATETAIRSAERAMGLSLPSDLRAFYRLHDGLGGKWLLHYGEFFSLAKMLDGWEAHRHLERSQRTQIAKGGWVPLDLNGPIRPVWWSPRRVPVTWIGASDGVMADLDPAAGGDVGQLVEFLHEVGPRCVLATSFTAWLRRLAAGLEAGLFECDSYGDEVTPRGYYERRESLNDWERRLAEPGVAPDRPR